MRKKALHTIVTTMFLAAAVCAVSPGSPLPVPFPPSARFIAGVVHGSPLPVPFPPSANLKVAATAPGTPMPVPLPPLEVRS